MNEMLLQFIWQFSLFQPTGLFSTQGEQITIIFPGKKNTDAGPDFSEARIKIGNTTLVGNIELHVRNSDWLKHGHDNDQAYHNLILHVVYENDVAHSSFSFPTLELKNAITPNTIAQYQNLIGNLQPIACNGQLQNVKSITWEGWLHSLLAERWEEKLIDWKAQLQQSAGDWSLLFYWRMAMNFGFKTNAVPFLLLAQSIPLNTLSKHKEKLLQIEALLFGQAGMLNADFKDEYPNQLKAEYQYLRKKYKLQPISAHLWKFLRLRPANFPTIRIAQFASLVHRSLHLFSKMIESFSYQEMTELLDVHASDYWQTHFRLDDEQSKKAIKNLGKTSVGNIIINTIAPVKFLYAQYQGKESEQEAALQLLQSIMPEQNNIIMHWDVAGKTAENALHSQAMIQLFHRYCEPKKCLHCTVGLSLMKQ